MSEVNFNKTIRMINTTPNLILFNLSPYDNPSNSRLIRLGSSNTNKVITMPISLALGVFTNSEVYRLFKKGYFTFDHTEELLEAAKEANLYFAEQLDFTPASEKTSETILTQLIKGSRAAIEAAIKEYGKDRVMDVAKANLDKLSVGVKTMLEQTLKVSFSLNQE